MNTTPIFLIFLSIMNSMNHSRAFYSVRAVKTIFFWTVGTIKNVAFFLMFVTDMFGINILRALD